MPVERDIYFTLESERNDPVNHPNHYCKGEIECIDAIRASMTDESFAGYCKGNAIKYIWRYENKGKEQDLEKAIWYLNKIKSLYQYEDGAEENADTTDDVDDEEDENDTEDNAEDDEEETRWGDIELGLIDPWKWHSASLKVRRNHDE